MIFDLAGPVWVFLTMAAVSAPSALPTLSRTMRRLPRTQEVAVK